MVTSDTSPSPALRFVRAVRGDGATLSGLGRDHTATAQAFMVTAAASALGQYTREPGLGALALGAVSGCVGLVAWTVVMWAGTRLMRASPRYMSLLRGIGFAGAPFALSGIPIVGVAAVVGSIALQVAVLKHIGGLTTGRAVVAVLVPFVLVALLVATVTQQ
jgi:hypothetical protein